MNKKPITNEAVKELFKGMSSEACIIMHDSIKKQVKRYSVVKGEFHIEPYETVQDEYNKVYFRTTQLAKGALHGFKHTHDEAYIVTRDGQIIN